MDGVEQDSGGGSWMFGRWTESEVAVGVQGDVVLVLVPVEVVGREKGEPALAGHDAELGRVYGTTASGCA